MKKLLIILTGVILAIGLSSCEKQDKGSPEFPGQGAIKAGAVTFVTPAPNVLENYPGPFLIPAADEKDRGGNRTCEDVNKVFPDLFGPEEDFECGEKVDIDEYFEGDTEDEARMYIGDMFPNFSKKGVWVNDDGTIGFETDGSTCVKAVIVKGGNKASVYVYPDGIDTDDFLASPELKNGNIPWVSNLTFCCSCDVPDDPKGVIAFKVFYSDGGGEMPAYSVGTPKYFDIGWCNYLEINDYPTVPTINIENIYGVVIGTATVAEGNVTMTLTNPNTLVLERAYLYVGLEADLPTACPVDYETSPDWMEEINDDDNSVSFTW